MSLIKIGPYRLGKTLGVGSFSKVKMAVHEPTGKKVAIKILNRNKLTHMDMGQKVRREINILRLFMHSHIIRLYEVIDTPTDIFVVMEYVSGGELFDYIVSRGRLAEDEARRFFQQIISGVEYCHSHMVVHRDLKPENLLLDDCNNVKIADFGLSNMMRDGYFLKTSCGSPNYAAPEVISGNLYAGPEVDVWSCGVILYALLCGSLPFDDENIPNLFCKIKEGIFTLPSYLSDLARDIIPKMLVVDPMERISISDICKHEWFKIGLPRYLQVSSQQAISKNQIIDEDALEAVVQMGWSRESVLEALSMGPELLTNSKLAHMDENRPMAVAYHLMLDHKRKFEQDEEKDSNLPSPANMLRHRVKDQSLSDSSGPALESASPIVTNSEGPPSAPCRSAASSSHTEEKMEVAADAPSAESQLRVFPQKFSRRWYLGIASKKEPCVIMEEVYRALSEMGLQWKVMTPFKLKARCRSGDCEDVKLGLQLYKTMTSSYVLDVQKLTGDMFPFLDICARFTAQLKLERHC